MVGKEETRIIKAIDYDDDLMDYLEEYDYKEKLTSELDNIKKDFDQEIIDKILLWKSPLPYVELDDECLKKINNLKEIENIDDHKHKIKKLLEDLLKINGVGIARATTILRFINPNVFQIMDKRAYRAVFGEKLKDSPDNIVDKYFQYLKELKYLCEEKSLKYSKSDRILYEFDQKVNGKLGK